jgi:hypothetical protein
MITVGGDRIYKKIAKKVPIKKIRKIKKTQKTGGTFHSGWIDTPQKIEVYAFANNKQVGYASSYGTISNYKTWESSSEEEVKYVDEEYIEYERQYESIPTNTHTEIREIDNVEKLMYIEYKFSYYHSLKGIDCACTNCREDFYYKTYQQLLNKMTMSTCTYCGHNCHKLLCNNKDNNLCCPCSKCKCIKCIVNIIGEPEVSCCCLIQKPQSKRITEYLSNKTTGIPLLQRDLGFGESFEVKVNKLLQ